MVLEAIPAVAKAVCAWFTMAVADAGNKRRARIVSVFGEEGVDIGMA